MLSSSWFVAIGVQAARDHNARRVSRYFSLAFLCGLGFVIAKILEYTEKIQAGFVINSNDFFMYYYMLTGIHFMHVLLGMTMLAFFVRYSPQGSFDAVKVRNFESGASFWHVVDLLWVVLFALLYLLK
jgi:nitric oxide reductase NorE protein